VININIKKYGDRNWAVYDGSGNLICVTVYKKGAIEVFNRLSGEEIENHYQPPINLQELVKLQKEFKQLNKKFNSVFQEIKSRNKQYEAVL